MEDKAELTEDLVLMYSEVWKVFSLHMHTARKLFFFSDFIFSANVEGEIELE
jgi:hypothetical protein